MPTQQQLNAEEVTAMVDRAAFHNHLVCVHCHSKKGITNASENDLKCIEHCMLADNQVIEMILQKDVLMVPTRWIIEQLSQPRGIDRPKLDAMLDPTWKKYKLVYTTSRKAHTKPLLLD
eukprot:13229149-Ditylum_brightwellii.AAC.1